MCVCVCVCVLSAEVGGGHLPLRAVRVDLFHGPHRPVLHAVGKGSYRARFGAGGEADVSQAILASSQAFRLVFVV